MKRTLKRLLLGKARKPMRVPFGLYKGLLLSIDPTVDSTLYFGLYERETYAWLCKSVRQALSLVDVGTGSGELTAWGLSHAHIQRVLAYDPAVHRWGLFRDNLRLNGHAANSRLSIFEDSFLGPHRVEKDLHLLNELPQPILFKIDVDGGEGNIMDTLAEKITHMSCLFLIETHSQELDASCREILTRAKYEVRSIPQAWWRYFFPENRPLDFNQWLVARRPNRRA